MQSTEKTVAAYLRSLPTDRRRTLGAVREVIRGNLHRGFEEVMNWGMITYQVPLRTFPETYNGKPLMYAALASQRHYMVVYLTGIYASSEARRAFERRYKATGKRWDVGRSCIRFRSLEDLPLPLVGQAIASLSVNTFIDLVNRGRSRRKGR